MSETPLWIPGARMELHHEYPVPGQQEINERWTQYAGGSVMEAPGVFGAMRMPERQPAAYASVDLCEVVRKTSESARNAAIPYGERPTCVHPYAEGLGVDDDDIVPIVQAIMNAGMVEPMQDIKAMHTILENWRTQGVYVVANTSTLQGCELATIDFFDTYLPDAFDALLLPRNHDGQGKISKGDAARNLIDTLSASEPTTAVHIDDLGHHNRSFRNAVSTRPNTHVATFQPQYPSCTHQDPGSVQTATPLEAFQQADMFLAAQIHGR